MPIILGLRFPDWVLSVFFLSLNPLFDAVELILTVLLLFFGRRILLKNNLFSLRIIFEIEFTKFVIFFSSISLFIFLFEGILLILVLILFLDSSFFLFGFSFFEIDFLFFITSFSLDFFEYKINF